MNLDAVIRLIKFYQELRSKNSKTGSVVHVQSAPQWRASTRWEQQHPWGSIPSYITGLTSAQFLISCLMFAEYGKQTFSHYGPDSQRRDCTRLLHHDLCRISTHKLPHFSTLSTKEFALIVYRRWHAHKVWQLSAVCPSFASELADRFLVFQSFLHITEHRLVHNGHCRESTTCCG